MSILRKDDIDLIDHPEEFKDPFAKEVTDYITTSCEICNELEEMVGVFEKPREEWNKEYDPMELFRIIVKCRGIRNDLYMLRLRLETKIPKEWYN